jgi:ribosomal protein S18 acetylase RimI-like enzyme
MKIRCFLVTLICIQFVFFDLQSQHYDNVVVMRDFDINIDKQVIKDMIEHDWDQLCGGYTHGYRETIVDTLLENVHDCFKVLYQDNQIIGFIEYGMKSENRAHIDSLAIHKDYRKKGFGIILLQYAFDDIAFWNIDYITIDVMLNNDIARNLYEGRFGFTPLYVKYYKFPESDQESAPVLSLGRAINFSLWDKKAQESIIIADVVLSAPDEEGVTYRLVRIDNEI